MYFSNIQNKIRLSFFNKTLLVFFTLMVANTVLAGTGNTEDPLGDRLCAILKIMMGPTAKAIATIAIIFVAIGLFAGRMTWLTVIPIIIGIIVIFAAPSLVVFLSGTGNSDCSATS